METKKEIKIRGLCKDLVKSLITRAVSESTYRHESLSIGNFYQDFYAIKINDLSVCLDKNLKRIKSSKNKRAIQLYDESLDSLMKISSLRNEEDIMRNLFRCNECINDALYILDNMKGK